MVHWGCLPALQSPPLFTHHGQQLFTSFFQMKGISISAAKCLWNKSGNSTCKASEVRSAESLNLEAVSVRRVWCVGGLPAALLCCCVFFYLLLMVWGTSLFFMGNEP